VRAVECDARYAVNIFILIAIYVSCAWLILLASTARANDFAHKKATERIVGAVSGSEMNKSFGQTLQVPRFNHPSKYTASWEPYIASNVYMYAVPLAMFLRKARELDFSAAKFDRSIQVVRRVFRVFTPQVVDAVSFYLESRQASDQSPLLQTHMGNLGPFAPPDAAMSLRSLEKSMQNLLEEIELQHLKKIRELNAFDWLLGKVEGLFGQGVVSGEEKDLDSLTDRAKLIARLPLDYNLLPRKRTEKSSGTSEQQRPIRTKDGKLTKYGLDQILKGKLICNPEDIPYDRMRSPVKGYENAYLVDMMIRASDTCNRKLGLASGPCYDDSIRVNLRFLADYRLIIAVVAAIAMFGLSLLRNFL
jgi:hypothetical protein